MKKQRHARIKELISRYAITTQEELLDRLKEEGYNVTQATISRDIKELRLIKALDSNEVYRYMSPKTDVNNPLMNYNEIFKNAVVSIDYAMNTVVVKCHTGMAQAACAAIDKMQYVMVVGTLAGDDTIFLLTRNESQAKSLSFELSKIIVNN